MGDITGTLDEETCRRARIVVARRDTSVSALVREFVSGLDRDVERRDDWDAVWETVDAWEIEVGERPTRSRTYDGRS